ncbi:MAG: hypothetical protein JXR45_21095 [Deltaproteobacteria bacterium]|nr:hypothetical protein [Deltaproteobacteria bacterium]
MNRIVVAMCTAGLFAWAGCGDDPPPGTEADHVGVGAECVTNEDCPQPVDDSVPAQICLQQFDGGYCGIEDCTGNDDCPDGSACVAHDDGVNYCFRVCLDKSECNLNRTIDNQSNCSSNITFVDPNTNVKACVPPSS